MACRGSGVRVPSAPPGFEGPLPVGAKGAAGSGSAISGQWHAEGQGFESPQLHQVESLQVRRGHWPRLMSFRRPSATRWDSAAVGPLRRALIVVGTVLFLVGAVAGVLNREVLDGDRFAAHVDAVRTDPYVARQLGTLVANRIIEAEPDLTAVRPLLETTSTGVVGSPTLAPVVRVSATPLHSALLHSGYDPVVLRLADVAAVVMGVGS